jgi:chorismate synthase
MAGNSFGTAFKLMTFGESHGDGLGGIIDGCPAGVTLDMIAIQSELARRRPGQSAIVTQRKEADEVEFFSGIFEGVTTGTPIGFLIRNTNQKSKDYSHLKDTYRPSHADYTYDKKYDVRDYRGGGRSSARETVCRVVAGAIARQMIPEMRIRAYVSQVGSLALEKSYQELDLSLTESNPVRCPDPGSAAEMELLIREVRKAGDTIGGVVTCVIENVPAGLGEPVFDKLHARLGQAMLSINAVKGFEYGSGFNGVRLRGSQHNDTFESDGSTRTNHSGGIQGGITNGMPIYFQVAFKPVATLIQDYETIDKEGNTVHLQGKGRHDPCVVPRAVPIVEAMAALVMADFYLLGRLSKI